MAFNIEYEFIDVLMMGNNAWAGENICVRVNHADKIYEYWNYDHAEVLPYTAESYADFRKILVDLHGEEFWSEFSASE